jgi:hypothetical protein
MTGMSLPKISDFAYYYQYTLNHTCPYLNVMDGVVRRGAAPLRPMCGCGTTPGKNIRDDIAMTIEYNGLAGHSFFRTPTHGGPFPNRSAENFY